MPSFIPPTFKETCFICKDCGHMFQGRDCKKGRLGEKSPADSRCCPFPPLFGLQGPKCPECGSRNTEENPAVVY
ncbi:MAG: hypothetical protein K6G18_08855 [Treponema sp.]|nr:hypothetical protein [Treponema sp.]